MPDTPKNQPEHETHTTALVFLVLATIIICVVVLVWSGEINQSAPDADQSDTTTSATDLPDNRTSGSIVPINRLAASESSDLSRFPQDVYINQSGIQSNFTSEFEDNRFQHVVIFNDGQSVADLSSAYKNWMADSQFTLETNQSNSESHTLVGMDGDDRFTIAITRMEQGSRVQLNYVTR